jgi:sulfoxide reductase heme-binding subunit YedZ
MAIAAATSPSPFWYMTRGTGIVALILLTCTVALGIANVRRTQVGGAPRFVLQAVHRNLSLLAVTFLIIHIGTTLLDGFAPISVMNVVVPFTSSYRPIWLGLGTVAFDLLLAITITSLLRLRLGYEVWRATHWLAYASWPFALVHGLGTGTDPKAHWMQIVTVGCVAVVLVAVLLRVSSGWSRGTYMPARLSAVGVAALFPIGLIAWLPGGPLGTNWARRAGTPANLVAHAQTITVAARTGTASASAGFSASVSGRVRQSRTFNGLQLVDITLTAAGQHLNTVHIRIEGQPVQGGGVQMTSSRVTFGTRSNPDRYSGRITALNGTNIQASVADSGGAAYGLLAQIHLAPGSSGVSGALTASPQGGHP